MGDLRQAFEYASKNPNSDFAKNLKSLAESGSLNVEAKKLGVDLSGFQQPKLGAAPIQTTMQEKPQASIPEKILQFTGGDTIAKGLGQGLAFGEIHQTMSDIQTGQGIQQQKLIQAIRDNKAKGKDTKALEKALVDLTGGIVDTGAGVADLYNPNKLTDKQVVGDALQLATTVVGAGELPGAAKAVTKTPGIVKGAIQGVKTGAKVGAIYGASGGVSQGLKQDKSAGDIAIQGLEGAVGGGVTGGVLGGVAGGISGGIQQHQINKLNRESEHALDLVAPKATEQVKIQALKEGRVTEQGLLEASKIQPSKRDFQLKDAIESVVSSKNSDIQNLNLIDNKVSELNSGLKAYVKVNKVPFNTNQLRTQLNKGKDELNLIFASDANAEKTYNAVVDEFVSHVKSKDTSGLFQARQEFDKIPAIKKLLDSQGLSENTRKEVVLTARDMANKYVASLLPKGNKFRETLLKESKMIEVIGNIAEKNSNTIGLNKLQVFTKKYPFLKSIGKAAVGLGIAGGVGVGASVISSSD